MEAGNNQQIPSSQAAENQSLSKNIHNEKGSLLIAGIIALVLLVGGGGYYFGMLRSSPVTRVSQSTTAPEPSTIFSPSNSLTLYSRLSNNSLNEEMVGFSDNLLKVSFSYPKKYFSQSFKADEKNLYAGVFFLRERNEKKEKNIAYTVNCELINRRDPAGVCREGAVGDLEVNINLASKVPDYDEDKNSSYNQCQKETISGNKIIYSCSTQLSIDPRDKGMRYSLYLISDTPKVIKISIGKPEDFSDLIRSIVSSAKILP